MDMGVKSPFDIFFLTGSENFWRSVEVITKSINNNSRERGKVK